MSSLTTMHVAFSSVNCELNEKPSSVTTWDPPHEFRMMWDYTDEGPSELRLQLSELGAGQTRLILEHTRIAADAVQYGAGWHVHLDHLCAYLTGGYSTTGGCDDEGFLAAYRAPRAALRRNRDRLNMACHTAARAHLHPEPNAVREALASVIRSRIVRGDTQV